MNKGEREEREYLEQLKRKLKGILGDIDEKLKQQTKELQESKEYLYENKSGMDHVEKVSMRQSIEQAAMLGELAVEKKKRIQKLLQSPYFGRIDFRKVKATDSEAIYVGVHAFTDENEQRNIVHDWRAPVSTMYYDFELGEAYYEAPSGKVSGEISLKRQYRIRKGEMEFMLENSLNIHDDILQNELSKASDEKMKNIVATIQRDQNRIIRNEQSHTLIIQGVAGSGKTSIALHRIAFLLYRFKESISSRDILILSPNKVFADYISNVLPELGEEKIPEKGMEELAAEVLEGKFKFRTFFEQVTQLLEKDDAAFKKRIRFKASFEFHKKLNQYLLYIENNCLKTAHFKLGKFLVPDWFIRERFDSYHRVPLMKRLPLVLKDVEENMKFHYKIDITADDRKRIKKGIMEMFDLGTLRQLYKGFYDWLDQPEMFVLSGRSVLEYADVFPLIYLKIKLEGIRTYDHIQHFLIDEMQDYTPVQYAVLAKMFPCKKTILGDANQSVNPYSSTSAEEIQKVLPEADAVKLLKSYRSTYEITHFAQRISPNDALVPIERHGEQVEVTALPDVEAEYAAIHKLIDEFKNSEYESLGIICKTQRQAEKLLQKLDPKGNTIYLLNAESATFTNGVILTSAHLSKGLEFDRVLIPQVTQENYNSDIDKSMLYIACTRAMHQLSLTYSGEKSEFLG